MLLNAPTKCFFQNSNFAIWRHSRVIPSKKKWLFQNKVELSSLVNGLRDVLQIFDKPTRSLHILLPKPEVETGSTKSKDNLFAHYYKDIIEHPTRHIRLSFRFENNKSCIFSIKKLELHGNQLILTEIAHFNHREIHYLYKNRYYFANKCE